MSWWVVQAKQQQQSPRSLPSSHSSFKWGSQAGDSCWFCVREWNLVFLQLVPAYGHTAFPRISGRWPARGPGALCTGRFPVVCLNISWQVVSSSHLQWAHLQVLPAPWGKAVSRLPPARWVCLRDRLSLHRGAHLWKPQLSMLLWKPDTVCTKDW